MTDLRDDPKINKKHKVSVDDTTQKTIANTEGLEIHWKPSHIMRRDIICEGIIGETEVLNEWRRRLMSKQWHSKQINGEWCLGEFQGMREIVSKGEFNSSAASSTQEFEDAASMQAALQIADGFVCEGFNYLYEEFQEIIGGKDTTGQVPDTHVEGVVESSFGKAGGAWS